MAQLTYENKEAINVDTSIPAKNKCMADDMNQIKNVVNQNETKILIAISGTAPSQCTTGDLYYNSTSKKIFTATGTNTWSSTGENPTKNTIYVLFSTNASYSFDGTDLVEVGCKEVYIGSSQPTGNEVIWIDPDEYSSVGGGVYKKVFELGTPTQNQNLKYYPINNIDISKIEEQFDYLYVTLKQITENDNKKPFTMVINTHNFIMDDSQQNYSSMSYSQIINEVGDSPYLKVYEISFFYLNGDKVNIQPLYCIPYDPNASDPTLEYDIDTIVGIKY